MSLVAPSHTLYLCICSHITNHFDYHLILLLLFILYYYVSPVLVPYVQSLNNNNNNKCFLFYTHPVHHLHHPCILLEFHFIINEILIMWSFMWFIHVLMHIFTQSKKKMFHQIFKWWKRTTLIKRFLAFLSGLADEITPLW